MSSLFISPAQIIKELPLKEEMVIADFGCGVGYFSLALAKELKLSGKIIALDICQSSLDVLFQKAKTEEVLCSIETKKVDLEKNKGSGLLKESCDLVIISNLLFQLSQKDVILKEAKKILRNNGLLVVIDWHPEKLPNREFFSSLTKEEALALIKKHNFILEKELFVNEIHYGFLFKKII